VAWERVRRTDAAVERKGREGRKEILPYFASFATSAFNRDVLTRAQSPEPRAQSQTPKVFVSLALYEPIRIDNYENSRR
jgi:hypothetical protein